MPNELPQPNMQMLEPVEASSIPAAPSAPPRPANPPAPNPNLRTTLAPSQQLQPDSLRQFYNDGVPQIRISPLPTTASASINAAAQGIAAKAVASAASATTEDVESIGINKQTGTSYTVQTNDLDTLITLSNNSGGTIILPGPSSVFGFVQIIPTYSFTNSSAAAITNTKGNLMIMETHVADGGPVYPTVSDTLGNTWNKIAVTVDGGNTACSFWYAFDIKGGSNTVTVAGSGSAAFSWSLITEYSGFSTADPLDAFAAHSGGTSSVTTGFNNCLVHSGILFPGAYNPTAGPGFTSRYNDTLNLVQDQLVPALGTVITATSTPAPTGNGAADFVGSFRTSTGPASFGFPYGWFTYIQNTGTGTFTLTSTALIDGSANNVSVGPGQGLLLVWDGTNWFTERGIKLPLPVSVANGGTGDSTLTAHNVLLGEGTLPVAFAPPGAAGTILTSNGTTSDPTFQSAPGAAGTVLTSNGAGFASTFQVLPAPPTPTVGSNILLGSFTVSDSADQRGNTIFAHIRGREMMNIAQSYNAKFVFGTGQTAGTVTVTSIRIYQMNQVNPSGSLFAAYTLSAAANASGGNTVYTGTNLGTLIPGSKLNIAGFGTGANNGTGFTVTSSTSTTVTVNNPSGVAETHAGTAQLCVLVIGSLVSFPITTVGGAQETIVSLGNLALNSNFDYVIAVYFKTADTSIPVILGVADTFANDGNQLRGATYTGDGTTVAVNGVLPAFTGYPTALLMHQFTVTS